MIIPHIQTQTLTDPYREFEFSVKCGTDSFEKLFSSFIFFWKSQLQYSVLNYQSAHRLTSFPCSVQGSELRPRVYWTWKGLGAFPTCLRLHSWRTLWWHTFFIILIIFALFILSFNNFGDDIVIIKDRSTCDTSKSRSANDSADRFSWMASLSNSCNFSRSPCKLLNGPVCCSPLLWYKGERLSFGYGLWGFVLHTDPLVEEQTLYLEAGKSGWCSWVPWFSGGKRNFRSQAQHFCFEPGRMSRVFLSTLQIKLLSSNFFSVLSLYRKGSCFTFLKHHGFLDLPFTNISNFSQVALATAMPVNLTLLFQNTFLQIGGKFLMVNTGRTRQTRLH